MNQFYIPTESGYVILNLQECFPCTRQKRSKLFALIHKYCTDEDKRILGYELHQLQDSYQAKLKGHSLSPTVRKRLMVLYKRVSQDIVALEAGISSN